MHLYEFLEWNPTAKNAGPPLFVLLLHTKPLKLSRLEPLFLTENALLLWRQKNGLWSTTTGMTLFHLDALHLKKTWFFKGSLHAVMVLFRTIAFWRTLLCRNGSLLEFRVLCSRPFVFKSVTVKALHYWFSGVQWSNYTDFQHTLNR